MNRNLKQFIAYNKTALERSPKTLRDIYTIMFHAKSNILCEWHDGFRVQKQTYGEVEKQIEKVSAVLHQTVGAKGKYIALSMENCPDWIVAFWAILKSGNKPYLVNMRYPDSLTTSILETLKIQYTICLEEPSFTTTPILFSSLQEGEGETPSMEVFENEIAFSSSATSMNQVVCFYTGYQIAMQILNFQDIIKQQPRMTKHYKGQLKQLAFLPFYHVFGLFAVYFWFTFFGRTLVFLRDYSSQTIVNTCRKHGVTHIFAVPMLWHTIEKEVLANAREQGEKTQKKLQKALAFSTKLQNLFPGFGAWVAKRLLSQVTEQLFGKSVMFCINGGSYVKDSAMELINGLGYCLHNGYGMSEIGITSVELRKTPKYRNQNAIGNPFASVEYKVDEQGILQVRGSSLCVKKLFNGKEQTFEGWFNTGDFVEYKQGSYHILGRLGDVVIGENGENINPDMIEKLFSFKEAKAFSVLGLEGEKGQELSLVVQVGEFASNNTLQALREEAYTVNDTLPKTAAISKFYFTVQELLSPGGIKVSRSRVQREVNQGNVTLVPFGEFKGKEMGGERSPLAEDVTEIVAKVLGIPGEKVAYTAHVFYDLGATSIQYFSMLTLLAERFKVQQYKQNDQYCYTVKEICEYLEKRL